MSIALCFNIWFLLFGYILGITVTALCLELLGIDITNTRRSRLAQARMPKEGNQKPYRKEHTLEQLPESEKENIPYPELVEDLIPA